MLLFDGGFGVLAFAVWVFCIIDVITTRDDAIRNLPKWLWLAIVILLLDVGSIAWLVAGRDWSGRTPVAVQAGRRPGRSTAPDDDEEFLAGLRARAEEQRRRAREQGDDPPSV